MKRSENRILTTHVGSLPRPKDLIELYQQDAPDGTLLPRLKSAVAEIVKQQVAAGIDVVDDGEFGKAMRRSVDYGAWWSYIYDRLAGYEVSQAQAARGRQGWTFGSKERAEFAEFYAEDGGMGTAGQTGGSSSSRLFGLVCTGPVKYTGHARITARYRKPESRSAGRANRRGFHARRVARHATDHPKPALQESRGLHLGAGGSDPRRIQGNHRRRFYPADR